VATQTYNFTHASNSAFTTRVVLTDGALGKVNYNITFRRSSTNWTSYNLYNAGDSRAPVLNVNILGQQIPETYWQYDFRNGPEVSATFTRKTGSNVLTTSNPFNFSVGMTRISGTGIPAGATITSIGFSSITISANATSNGTSTATFQQLNTNLVQSVRSGTVDVAAGVTSSISGTNNARSTIGAATLSGSFTPTAPPTIAAPSAPTGLSVSSITKNSATLSWTASTGTVSRYRVYLNGSDAGTTTNTSFSFSGLASNTTHTLGVRAEGPDNNSSITSTTAKTLPDTFTVPNVVNQLNTTAVTNLINAGFGSVNQSFTTAGATLANNRTVISQSPAAGTIATQGNSASIQSYSFERTVPNIIGLTKSQGESQLQTSQFSNFSSTLTTSGATLANNKLIATQNPASGTSLNILDQVTFTINDYRIPIPNIIGLSRQNAINTLNAAGFTKLTITTTETGATVANNNTVFSQSPTNSGTTYNPVDQTVSFVVYTLGVVGKKFTSPTTSEPLTSSSRFDGTQWVRTLLAKRFNGTIWEDIA
jgi:beta-lactam-binding protein with PASTA domain